MQSIRFERIRFLRPEDAWESVLTSDAFPTLPTVASRLVSMTSQEETRFSDIAKVISQDVSLAA